MTKNTSCSKQDVLFRATKARFLNKLKMEGNSNTLVFLISNIQINPFQPDVTFLYPLKTSENLKVF